MDEDMFDDEDLAGLPDDFEVDLIETRLYWYSDDYDDDVQAFQDQIEANVEQKETVYDVRFDTTFQDGYMFREAWILYGGDSDE